MDGLSLLETNFFLFSVGDIATTKRPLLKSGIGGACFMLSGYIVVSDECNAYNDRVTFVDDFSAMKVNGLLLR